MCAAPLTSMELNIDFDVFIKVIGLLMALVAVVGAFVISFSLLEHNREREQKMSGPPRRQHWDHHNSPESFGHH
jgi:hypothetical protein